MSDEAHAEKSHAALSSVLWSGLLTLLKLVAGVATGSLGILSEALHSTLDLLSAGLTYFAVNVSARPADEDHPYGHGKVEDLSALAEAGLLVITCVWVVYEAVKRLFWDGPELDITWWAFGVVIISIVVDSSRSAMLRRAAKKHKSMALEADAMHFTTDIWSSSVVLFGLICVETADYLAGAGTLSRDSWVYTVLVKMDSVAALAVAFCISTVVYDLSKRAIHALLDGGSDQLTALINTTLAKEVPEYEVRRLRLRDTGTRVFIDLDLGLPPDVHVEDAHDIADSVSEIIATVIPESECSIHIEPTELSKTKKADLCAHQLALRHHIRIHGFREWHDTGSCLFMDVEMPGEADMHEACQRTDRFRKELSSTLKLQKVVCRIEPLKRDQSKAPVPTDMTVDGVRERARAILAQEPAITAVQGIEVDKTQSAPFLMCYITVGQSLTVAEAHACALKLEKALHASMPYFGKVVVLLTPPAA